jgi:hypothetical protein
MRAYVPWGAEAVEHRIEVRLEVGPGHVLHRRRRRRNVMAGDEALRQVRGNCEARVASTDGRKNRLNSEREPNPNLFLPLSSPNFSLWRMPPPVRKPTGVGTHGEEGRKKSRSNLECRRRRHEEHAHVGSITCVARSRTEEEPAPAALLKSNPTEGRRRRKTKKTKCYLYFSVDLLRNRRRSNATNRERASDAII